MSKQMSKVSFKGKEHRVRSLSISPNIDVVMHGKIVRIGQVRDAFWLPSKVIPVLPDMLTHLKGQHGRPDIFMASQKLPHMQPMYPYYYEFDNLAVAHFQDYSEWFAGQVARDARSQIRKAEREGVRTEIVPFTDELVEGIRSIYNEIPIRQGRKFWHYGKDIAAVRDDNSGFLDRSLFIGAYFKDELIGFIKLVFDDQVAHILQILSKSAHFIKRPNNALLAKAIEVCVSHGAHYLTYGSYVYGKKEQSSLTEFKKSLGFNRVDIPCYFIPLTLKGKLALRLGLHRALKQRIPATLVYLGSSIRLRLYKLLGKSR